MPAPYGDGFYAVEPPSGDGLDITDIFHIVEPKPGDPDINSAVDKKYPNVAIITFDMQNQFGGMWAKKTLDLTRPFAAEIYLYLNRQYGLIGNVADGMTFTMRKADGDLNAIGGMGEGLGVFRGRKYDSSYIPGGAVPHGQPLSNALSVEFDTFRNYTAQGAFVDDPAGTAHCSLVIPKAPPIQVSDHHNTQTFTPVQDWVRFTVKWTPDGGVGGTLEYSFNNQTHLYHVLNVLNTFGGTEVYWGFTGATGGWSSVQAAAITRFPHQGVKIEKKVTNALGMDINHGSVLVGETLTYTVRVTALPLISSIGPVVVEDTISTLTGLVSANVMVTTNTGGPFTVPSTYTSNLLRVATGQSLNSEDDWIEIRYNVKVTEDAAGTIYNSALVTAEGLPEGKESNTTDVSVFQEPEKWVSASSDAGKNNAPVKIGDKIIYEIKYANETGTPATITITDELDIGLTYVGASDGGNYVSADRTVTWTLNNVPPNSTGTVKLTVAVNENARVSVSNFATVGGDETGVVENPVVPENPVKSVAGDSAAGKDNAPVKAGDIITYEITYLNYSDAAATITITDRLPIGVSYHDSTPVGNYNSATRTVTWTLTGVASGTEGSVKLQVKVNDNAAFQIINYASVQVGTDKPMNTNMVVNPMEGSGCPNMKLATKCRMTINGQKTWNDGNNARGTRPETLDIVLYRDGEVYKTVTISADNNWKYTFYCLPVMKTPRKKYVYEVDEDDLPEGYTKIPDGYNIINTQE